MRARRIIGFMTAAAVLAAGLSPAFAPMDSSDANGDQQVDILDIQYVVAQVLAEGEAPAGADVNGDGRVDILDFQQILDDAAKEEDAGEAPTPPDAPLAVAQAPVTWQFPVERIAFHPDPLAHRVDLGRPAPVDAAPPPRLYLRNAPTHAPPALG